MLLEDERFLLKKAETADELSSAQKLRFAVFYTERNLTPPPHLTTDEDIDSYDDVTHHFIIIDKQTIDKEGGGIIGTWRVGLADEMARFGGFSCKNYFTFSRFPFPESDFLELSRVCLAPSYRNSAMTFLLFQGLASFLNEVGARGFLGMASFLDAKESTLLPLISSLEQNFSRPPSFLVESKTARKSFSGSAIDFKADRAAFKQLPPLVKAYLRLGCRLGRGFYVDDEMKTIDIFVLLDREWAPERYQKHFGDARFAS